MLTPIFTEEQLAAALSSPQPVLLFWAQPGCGHCMETKPVVRRFAMRHSVDVAVFEINVNMLEDAARTHRINGTPTCMVFVRGQRVARKTGALTEEQLERWVAKCLERP